MVENLIKFNNRILQIIHQEGYKSLFKYGLSSLNELFLIFYTKFKIKKLFKNYTINSLVDFTFSLNKSFIKPLQNRFEILKLLSILKKEKLKILLEIGTANGGNLFLFSKIADKNAIIVSIDLPQGPYGGGYSKIKIPLFKSYTVLNQKLFLIRADSHKKSTQMRLNNILRKNQLDFLFIDGDHTYEGVKKDFEMYSPFVKENGIIAFHDIVIHNPKSNTHVNEFWNEIKNDYPFQELIYDEKQKAKGIGVLRFKKFNIS